MSVVNRNILANLFGTSLVAALTIAITPAQIRILGIEAYGVVGFISTLQIAFTAFDLGLSSTLTRELAADQSVKKKDSIALVRTALALYYSIAALVGLMLAIVAAPIAQNWFNTSALSSDVLERSLQIIALFLALRWPVALYSGVLAGFQRHDTLNIVKSIAAIIRLAGGLMVLILWQTLDAYLWWIALSAVMEVALFIIACKSIYRFMPWVPVISVDVIKRLWRFSLSMNILGLLALIIVQMDRLIVSNQLTLIDLGQYNLAYTVATGLALATSAISSAVLPAFAAMHPNSDIRNVQDQYIKADRLMLCIVGFGAFILMVYGDVILKLWVGNESTASVAPLRYLALGFWCNAISATAYNFAVAKGRPKRFLSVNLVLIVPYAILIYVLVNYLGIVGAAMSWVALNLVYIGALVRPVHRDMLEISMKTWLLGVVLPVAVAGAALVLGFRSLAEMWYSDLSQSTSLLLLFASSISYGIFVLVFNHINPLKFNREKIL